MDNERQQELLELFNGTSYMPYHEALGLLESDLPKRARLIKRMLEDDIRQFKLKVYFWERYLDYGGKISLLEPESATPESLQYYVTPPEEHAYFWSFGDLSTKELKDWLQEKNIIPSFLNIKPANEPAYMDRDHEMYSYKLAAAIEAWEHFNVHGLTSSKQSPKANIVAWLEENATRLNLLYKNEISKTTIEDIAKIVNWKPEGGAPKS